MIPYEWVGQSQLAPEGKEVRIQLKTWQRDTMVSFNGKRMELIIVKKYASSV